MLTKLIKIVKKHQSDILLTIAIVLISLISFGAGWLTSPKINNDSQIIIQELPNNPVTASAVTASTETEKEKIEENSKEGKFVGSINSNKYHWPDCPWAKKIAVQNQRWFSSEEEAQKAGYVRCGNFEKYAP